jgi:cation/acetate symporter
MREEGIVTLTIQILVVASLLLYARAGLVALRRPMSDFYAAGRLVPSIVNGMAIAVCLVPMLALTGFAGALSQGWDGASLLVLGGGGGILLAAFFVVPYLRKFGGYTLPDFLAERFTEAGIRPLAVLAVILCSFPVLALALLALGAINMRVFASDAGTGIAAAVGMLLLCSVVAGMRSASLSQIAQYAVLLTVSALVLAILVWQRDIVSPLPGAAEFDSVIANLKLEAWVPEDTVNRFALLLCLAAGIASLPLLLQRGVTTPSVEEARNSFLWALPVTAALCLVAAPYVLLFGTPGLGETLSSGLLLTGALAACLAVASGSAIAIANALSHDLYYKGLHRTASTEQRVLVARTAVVLVAGLAAWAALSAPDAVSATTGSAFSLAASAFLPALLLGIWWKRATAQGALAGMLAGLAVCLYYLLAPRYIPFAFYESSSFLSDAAPEAAARYEALRQSYYLAEESTRAGALAAWEEAARPLANWWGVKRDFAAIFAVPVGALVMIGVSLFTPAPSRDVQSFVEDLRKPQPA